MKLTLLPIFTLFTYVLAAQTFSELTGTPFEAVNTSSIAFADVDGDGDQDVFITGGVSSFVKISKLYTNGGGGTFSEMMNTPFEGVNVSSIAFADVDGDNDQDVLLTGLDNSSNRIAKLYTNDGNGTFTEVMGTPFGGVVDGSIAFADVDGDNDQDVLITGQGNGIFPPSSRLYINDGEGTFVEMAGTPFLGLELSSVAFADIDGDNDQDLLTSGWTSAQRISKLYTNDGTGAFTEITSTPFDGISNGSVAFADVDGDNDQDLLLTGVNGSLDLIANLYTNDGTGAFSEVSGTPFVGVDCSSVAFADVDGDNDQDVLITGADSPFGKIAKLYMNDGGGTFTEMMGTPFDGVDCSAVAFADVDDDNDQDVLLTGLNGSFQRIAKLYLNGALPCFSTSIEVITACDAYTWIDGNTYTSSNNSASVTLTNTAGCDSIVMLDLTISNTTSGVDEPIFACDAYTWIDGNTYTASNNSASVTLSNTAGCDSIVMLNLTVNTVDDLSISLNDDTFFSSIDIATSYQWLDCDNNFTPIAGANGQFFMPGSSGNYALEVVQNGCTAISDCESFNTVGVLENNFETELKVFPNPTMGNFFVDLGAIRRDLEATLFDLNGKVLRNVYLSQEQIIRMSITEPRGIYLLKIKSEKKSALIRLVKQ